MHARLNDIICGLENSRCVHLPLRISIRCSCYKRFIGNNVSMWLCLYTTTKVVYLKYLRTHDSHCPFPPGKQSLGLNPSPVLGYPGHGITHLLVPALVHESLPLGLNHCSQLSLTHLEAVLCEEQGLWQSDEELGSVRQRWRLLLGQLVIQCIKIICLSRGENNYRVKTVTTISKL